MAFDAIVIALGNPGLRYLKTRHNAGFMLADLIAHEENTRFSLSKNLEAETMECSIYGKHYLFLKPQTYMNLSGQSLLHLYSKNKELRNIEHLVFHDEADLRLGRIKIKKGGSDAGHNGLKSLRAAMGHGESTRLRLGVGRPAQGTMDVADFLLQNFAKEEENQMIDLLASGSRIFRKYLSNGMAAAQSLTGELDVT